jgi:hypothetical protein
VILPRLSRRFVYGQSIAALNTRTSVEQPTPHATVPPVKTEALSKGSPVQGCKQNRPLSVAPSRRRLSRFAAVAIAGGLALTAPREAHARKPRPGHQGPAEVCPPPPSSDIETPTPLPSKTVSGCRAGKKVSYYYKFSAGAGQITLTATGRNRPAGSASALQAVLLTTKAESMCDISLGNNTKEKTEKRTCTVSAPQELVLRLNLDPESENYRVALDGPITLPAGGGPAAAGVPAVVDPAAPSSDIDAPTPFVGPTVKGKGTNQATSYYYALTVGPGEVTVTADGKNRSAATTDALKVTLQDRRANALCSTHLGNTVRDARSVVSCPVPTRQEAILRVDLSPETIDWRVKVEGTGTPR